MRVAIVGSRSFPQLKMVEWFVRDLPGGVTVISGGARGVDQAAASFARGRDLPVTEHLPELAGCKARLDYTRAYYARNQRIVDDADLVVAFTERENGGTWDTIKRARRAGKPVKVIRPSLFFPGEAEKDAPEATETQAEPAPEAEPRAAGRKKGKGPFHLKRVSLGSFALHLKRYMDTVAWADFIAAKADDPRACGELMLPDFIKFFEENDRFGKIHAVTQAPKSIRNAERLHPMDVVCKGVSSALGIPSVELFAAWDKKRRGRFAAHPEISVTGAVKDWIGKVVFVLDDVSTTNYTLQKSVKALTALEIHAHAVCWLQYA